MEGVNGDGRLIDDRGVIVCKESLNISELR